MTAQPARSYNTATLQYSTLDSVLLRSYSIDSCETTCPTIPITTTSTRNESVWQNIEKKLRCINKVLSCDITKAHPIHYRHSISGTTCFQGSGKDARSEKGGFALVVSLRHYHFGNTE